MILSFESCGKFANHPQYGITFSGGNAIKGRTVAVDPNVIPLGSKLKIAFPEKFNYLNGLYVAEDTGTFVKGNIVDIYFGEDAQGSNHIRKKVQEFGIQNVVVELVN